MAVLTAIFDFEFATRHSFAVTILACFVAFYDFGIAAIVRHILSRRAATTTGPARPRLITPPEPYRVEWLGLLVIVVPDRLRWPV